jgi:hypothetical protein
MSKVEFKKSGIYNYNVSILSNFTSSRILSAIDRVRMGNEGENDIEKLEYNLGSNTINFEFEPLTRSPDRELADVV